MSKEIIRVFENFQKARVQFAQRIAELSSRPRNIKALYDGGVMELLRPLLLDSIPSVQQSAALALGRLASYKKELAEAVVVGEILPQLVMALYEQNKHYKRAAAFVLRSVAKHNESLAQAVVDSNAVEALVDCLDELDPNVKEAAAWALGNIAKHSAKLAQTVVEQQQAVSSLVLCVQEPEIKLKRVAASALSHIASHSAELAQAVVDAEAIPNLVPLIESSDTQLKCQVCACLGHIATHMKELAEMVVEGEIFPKIFVLLEDKDVVVRNNACTVVREIARHSKELAKLVATAGGIPIIVKYISKAEGDYKLCGILALSFIAGFSESLAHNVIKAKALEPLNKALTSSTSQEVKSGTAFCLRHIGRHSSEHARLVAAKNILSSLLAVYMTKQSNSDVLEKTATALEDIITNCVDLDSLDALLLQDIPPNVLTWIVNQYAKVLPTNVESKKKFVKNRCLAKLQLIKQEVDEGSELSKSIAVINNCYPEEVVRFYSPGYDEILLQQIEKDS